jgi:TetR/AcrR family transcriptional regulator, regulator of cefoperazone and chloramphenicol sensitivity
VASDSLSTTPPGDLGAGAIPRPTLKEDARERLLHAALKLFAQQGFTKTSTRELAESAQVNVASISYYFGDKAGLYRAVFFEPMGGCEPDMALVTDPAAAMPQALRAFFTTFLEPLRVGDAAQLCMKLRFREILEPTGLWQEEIAQGIKPMHDGLVDVLCRHFDGPPDEHVQRLATCLAGLAVHLHVGRDITDAVAPGLNDGPDAVDRWIDVLVMYGLAMIDAEARRRATAAGSPHREGRP